MALFNLLAVQFFLGYIVFFVSFSIRVNMALELAHENIWFDKWRVDDAERQFYETKSSVSYSEKSW